MPTTSSRPYGDRPVRIGLQVQPQHAEWATIRRAVLDAEDMGVDVVFTWDHFYPLSGAEEGKHFECYSMLAAFAEMTDRVELGALVSCNSYRNPELLADMSRTIDHISQGRFVLGLGAGWMEKDYDEYGFEFGTPGKRLADLAAALPRVESRLGKLNPPPVRDIPVLIGGGGERKTLRLVARHAQIWHGFGEVADVERKHDVIDRWCVEEGRDPAAIERSTSVKGLPDESADALLGLGTRLFVVSAGGPTYDLSTVGAWVAFRDERNR